MRRLRLPGSVCEQRKTVQTIVEPTSMEHTQPAAGNRLPLNLPLHPLGGGYETDVYCTADERYVVRLKRMVYRSVHMV